MNLEDTTMKVMLLLFFVFTMGCQSNTSSVNVETSEEIKFSVGKEVIFNDVSIENKMVDTCKSNNYVSVLYELPKQDSASFELKIVTNDGMPLIQKKLNIRPEMSHIRGCNDVYTMIGFPCGGPCSARVFIFTDRRRPIKQFSYVSEVKNNEEVISYIKNEDFDHLILHNLVTSKEMIVDITDMNKWYYGHPDSLVIKNKWLEIYYSNHDKKGTSKKVSIEDLY